MFYVYFLQSLSHSNKSYIGFTQDLKQRFAEHNDGKSMYTAQFAPWSMIGFFGFNQEIKGRRFEMYLKTNSGRIFLKRYFKD
jgi:putative endonuclease